MLPSSKVESAFAIGRLRKASAEDPTMLDVLSRADIFVNRSGGIATLKRLMLPENAEHKHVIAELVRSSDLPDDVIFFNTQYLVYRKGAAKTAEKIRNQYESYKQAGKKVLKSWLTMLNRSARYAHLGRSEVTAFAIAEIMQEARTGSRRDIEKLEQIAAEDARIARERAETLDSRNCL